MPHFFRQRHCGTIQRYGGLREGLRGSLVAWARGVKGLARGGQPAPPPRVDRPAGHSIGHRRCERVAVDISATRRRLAVGRISRSNRAQIVHFRPTQPGICTNRAKSCTNLFSFQRDHLANQKRNGVGGVSVGDGRQERRLTTPPSTTHPPWPPGKTDDAERGKLDGILDRPTHQNFWRSLVVGARSEVCAQWVSPRNQDALARRARAVRARRCATRGGGRSREGFKAPAHRARGDGPRLADLPPGRAVHRAIIRLRRFRRPAPGDVHS